MAFAHSYVAYNSHSDKQSFSEWSALQFGYFSSIFIVVLVRNNRTGFIV